MTLGDAIAVAECAGDDLEVAEQEGLSASAIAGLRRTYEEAKEYADRGWFEARLAEQKYGGNRRKRELERRDKDARRHPARVRHYDSKDPEAYEPMHFACDGDSIYISLRPFKGSEKEKPPKWFHRLMPSQPRQRSRESRGAHRGRATRRRTSKSSRGSPGDPDEAKPGKGLPLESFTDFMNCDLIGGRSDG